MVNVTEGTSSTLTYEITKFTSSDKEVRVTGVAKPTIKNVTIPTTVKLHNVVYKVTSVKSRAFKSNTNITKVVLSANIKSVGKEAFYGCSNLKTLNIKTKKLTNGTVGSKAFSKVKRSVKVSVPKSKKKSYTKILKKRGLPASAKIK